MARSFVAAADPSGLSSSWYPILHLLEGVLGLEPPFDLNLLRRAVARAGLPDRDVPGLAEVFGISNPAEGLELAVRRREAHASVVRVLAAAQRRFSRLLYCMVDWDEYDEPSRDVGARAGRGDPRRARRARGHHLARGAGLRQQGHPALRARFRAGQRSGHARWSARRTRFRIRPRSRR